jgi:hypothetical protein
MYNIDDPQNLGIGAVRACGKAGNRDEVACTPWTRSKVNCNDATECAATALMQFYDPKTGLWRTTGWWNSANALTAIIDFSHRTGKHTAVYSIGSNAALNFNMFIFNEFCAKVQRRIATLSLTPSIKIITTIFVTNIWTTRDGGVSHG